MVLTLGGTAREMLAVAGRKPNHLVNLDVVLVLDNGVYLATGGQPTASSSLDMCALALACGWPNARTVLSREELLASLRWAAAEPGPTLVRVNVSTEQIATDFFLEDPVILARDFRDWLHDSAVPVEVNTS